MQMLKGISATKLFDFYFKRFAQGKG